MSEPVPVDPDQLYIVACRSLHAAYGPFVGLETAVTIARELNKTSSCMHLPVQFHPVVEEMKAGTILPTEDSAEKTIRPQDNGGYL